MSNDKPRSILRSKAVATRRTIGVSAGVAVCVLLAGAGTVAAGTTETSATGTSTTAAQADSRAVSKRVGEAKAAKLVDSWLTLWNGDYAHAQTLIAPDFRLHAAMMDGGDGSAVDSPAALTAWISQTRAAVPDLRFSVQVGPLVDGDHVAVRWRARGTYAGGMPGAAAPAGTAVDFTGTDILRVSGGQLAEYWVNSDTLLLLTQLQVSG